MNLCASYLVEVEVVFVENEYVFGEWYIVDAKGDMSGYHSVYFSL